MADELGRLMDWYIAQCEEVAVQAIRGPDDAYHFLTFRDGRCYEEPEETRARTPWQHAYGIRIVTTHEGSPGWRIVVDLAATDLDGASVYSSARRSRPLDRLACEINGRKFVGTGDPSKLPSIVDCFLQLRSGATLVANPPSALTADDLRRLDGQYTGWRRQVALTTVTGPDGARHQLVFRHGRYQEVGEVARARQRQSSDRLDRLQDWYMAQCQRAEQAGYRSPSAERPLIEIGTTDNPAWSLVVDLTGTELEGATMPKIEADNGDRDWLICKVEDGYFSAVGDPSKLLVMLDAFLELKPKR